ncbi:MAG: TfoX/Sxy family protein [Anaerolineae bacterium]|nr:TfoX/Sxy family protein [Anaerolineae bacterium]
MAYDETLAHRVREALAGQSGLTERKMFGGIAFMLSGNMCCGILKDGLLVRVGPEKYDAALANPQAHIMDFTGRPMKNIVLIDSEGVSTDEGLNAWLRQGVDFAASLPAK